MVAIAISFFVMIVAVSISSGFRAEFRKGVETLSGDVSVSDPEADLSTAGHPLRGCARYISELEKIEGVVSASEVVSRAGIVKTESGIDGAVFKGVAGRTDSLGIVIPRSMAGKLGLEAGESLPAYFVGERVQARKFTISGVYDDILGERQGYVIFARLEDMRRLNGWSEDEASAIEVNLSAPFHGRAAEQAKAEEIGARLYAASPEDENAPAVISASRRYPQIFSWLDLIDRNVLVILLLMTVVAGFNMVSGLLITLFRNTSTIGMLKAMGMTDRSVAGIFLRVSSRVVLKGMAIGNVCAILFCLLQGSTHLLRLDPENYFVSFVPVILSPWGVAAADLAAYAVIMLALLIPSLYVSRVDPAKTVRAK